MKEEQKSIYENEPLLNGIIEERKYMSERSFYDDEESFEEQIYN